MQMASGAGEERAHLCERFEMLLELGNVFVVRPANLPLLMREGHLAKLDAHLIYPYVGQRGDFASAGLAAMFPDMGKSFASRLFK